MSDLRKMASVWSVKSVWSVNSRCTELDRAGIDSLYSVASVTGSTLVGVPPAVSPSFLYYIAEKNINLRRVSVCAHGFWGSNTSKTLRDRDLVTMDNQ